VDLNGVEQPTAAQATWETYKAFAAEPVDEAAGDPELDMLNFVHGVADLEDGRKCFSLVLTRQFEVHDSRGEYDHMEHLHCGVSCDLTPELEQVGYHEGGFTTRAAHLDIWISEVEGSAGVAALMKRAGVQGGRGTGAGIERIPVEQGEKYQCGRHAGLASPKSRPGASGRAT
jgi:hypothetical protein